jgi:hypothetical protein
MHGSTSSPQGKTCRNPWCKQSFEITPDDLEFYDNVSPVFSGKKELIPPPALCPPCRSQRRLSFRNERHLYKRQCDLTKKAIISVYPPDSPFTVYAPDAWHSDQWDAMEFAMDIRLDQPFFEQFVNLRKHVPRMGVTVAAIENCSYSNLVWYCKNSYLCFDMGFCEDALYCYATYHSKNVADCAFTRETDLSYGLVDCTKCYNCISLLDCKHCHDALFSIDCHQCDHIAFCWNLRNKRYCLFNEQLTKEQWGKACLELELDSSSHWKEHERTFISLIPKTLRKDTHNLLCENCTGDYILSSRNCHDCFDAETCQDLRYCNRMDEKVVSSRDLNCASLAELACEGTSVAGNRILFTIVSYDPTNSDLLYCEAVKACSHCFGCIGLKHKKYCILNKQYTKEEYEKLVPDLIEHMRKAGEWGEFFPAELSPFSYNESTAQDYFPLTKEEVLKRGRRWRDVKDEIPKVEKIIPAEKLPDSIDDIPDDILNWAIECEITKRPYKIIRQELDFYRNMKLPVPRLHPDERHKRRMALRNPRKLWKRNCMKCRKEIQTSYAPDRPEVVYCETCYLTTVY